MGKTVMKILMLILIICGLAAAGLVGYGLATGRFDTEKRQQYFATWRGEKLVPPVPEVEQVLDDEKAKQASERIAATEIKREIITREIQRDIELARYMQTTLAQAQNKLNGDIKLLQKKQSAFTEKLDQYNRQAQQEGFQKALKNYSLMKPKSAKADFMKMDDDQVVAYLSQMKPDVATGILEQFRTPEELEKRLRVMEMLEQYRTVKLDGKNNPGA
ncbi:MAG: hypothetical protein JXD22_00790 [Sedimentisphaerales bacterium]|nr:hypothetical protein [Sedimentisphaerales bacterium]